MMSNTGGIGRAGGDGETHSPTSALRSATTPSNGACSVALFRLARARSISACDRSAAARAARQRACAVSFWLCSWSSISAETIRSSLRSTVRFRFRAARSAVRQASWAEAVVVARSCWERASDAFRSLSLMRIRISPWRTCAPGRNPMNATRPPISGLILARRRALTVPALLLVTVSSTVPRVRRYTVTGTGSGRTILYSPRVIMIRMNSPAAAASTMSVHFKIRRTAGTISRPSGTIGGAPEVPLPTRRTFLKTAALAGAGGVYLGGAHLWLRDGRWTPNSSFWVSRGREPVGPPLVGEREADLAIVGGGITGLSTALHTLMRTPGLRVVLVEAQYAGFGATGRSGGVLGNGTEIGPRPGTDDNVAHVIELVDRFGIGCDLERGPATQLDPYRYAIGLKRAAQGLGAEIHEGTRVLSFEDGPRVTLRGDRFTLRAPKVVVAVNGYMPRLGIARSRLFPAHTAAAGTRPLPPAVLAPLSHHIHV